MGGILYTLRNNLPSYTHANKRGDITSKADSTGKITYLAQYQAFGNQVATFGSTPDRQKSNSKDTDPTGLVNEGMRYYSLLTETFITRDPAGMIDGPNEYTYVKQNPWTSFDPEGLSLLGEVENFALGVGVGIAEGNGFQFSKTQPSPDLQNGRTVGHIATLIQGALETTAGINITGAGVGATIISLPLDASGVGTLPGAVISVAGVATTVGGVVLTGHGAAVTVNSANLLAQDLNSISSGGGSPPPGNQPAQVNAPPKNGPVKPGDTGTYGALKAQKKAYGETEPLDMDHQPSFAAQLKAEEARIGRELTPKEERALKNSTPATASPREDIHQATSPTYGGRNTNALSTADSQNLQAAGARDKAVFDKAMQQRQAQQQAQQQSTPPPASTP